jgi:hypothetical protein
MKIFAQFLITFFIGILLVTLFPSSVYAQNTKQDKDLHTWVQQVTIEAISAIQCQLTGIDVINPSQGCLTVDLRTHSLKPVQNSGGAIGFMGNMITTLYTPPAQLSDYTSYLSLNFGVTKPAYAQGVGFEGLRPLIQLWTIFRNLVYLIFVIVFVLIGLLVMLRVKIDPRTVMSIENQLPKLIITLLLVTFSYAIAGFLIDVMYVAIYILFNIFINPTVLPAGDTFHKLSEAQRTFNGNNAIGFFNELIGFRETANQASLGVSNIVQGLLTADQNNITQGVPVLSGLANIVDTIKNGGAYVLSWIVYMLAFLIFAVALLWAMFRLWFQLLQAFIFILVDVTIAPFWILLGVFPGSPLSFTTWFKDLLSYLSAFPTAIAIFLMGGVFINNFGHGPSTGFIPPLIGNPNDYKALSSLIGFGIVLLAPQAVQIMRDLFKAPSFKYTAAVGQAIGVGTGAPGGVVGQASHFGSTLYGLSRVPGVSSIPIIGPQIVKAGGAAAPH